MKLSFKPWHGNPYLKYNVFAKINGRKCLVERMMAPNSELALIKARKNFPEYKSLNVAQRGLKF